MKIFPKHLSRFLNISTSSLFFASSLLYFNPAKGQTETVKIYYTIFKDKNFVELKSQKDLFDFYKKNNLNLKNISSNSVELNVDTKSSLHKIEGFGAAITDSCLKNISELDRNNKIAFFKAIFNKDQGANLNLLRIPLSGNDFSAGHYTFNDRPQGEKDPEFRKLNFSKLEPLISFAKEAKKNNVNIEFIGSPWTPPAWMKDNNKLQGGQLHPNHYEDYAVYISKIISYLKSKNIDLKYLTILNEPLIGDAKNNWGFSQTYMDVPEQYNFITQSLLPKLAKKKLYTKILIHDHNWENADSIIDKFKPLIEAKHPYIGGVATHCYGGNYEVQLNLLKKYNDVAIINTECSGTLNHPNDHEYFQWWMQTQSLDSIQAGSRGSLGWNLCLDEKGGPRNNGCDGCRGIITINQNETKTEKSSTRLKFNPEYFAFKQVGPFIDKNSQVIKNELKIETSPTDKQGADKVHALTFLNSNRKLTIVMRNPTLNFYNLNVQTDNEFAKKINSKLYSNLILPPQSAVTIVLD